MTPVRLQEGLRYEFPRTHVARVGFLSSVVPHVHVERGFLRERLVTHFANERSLFRMRAFVSNQNLRTGQRLAADVTRVRLLPRMSPHVPFDGAGSDGFPADFTHVHAHGFVSRVLPLVDLVRPSRYFFEANGTLHLLLGGIVSERVESQSGLGSENFIAHQARVSNALVHVLIVSYELGLLVEPPTALLAVEFVVLQVNVSHVTF